MKKLVAVLAMLALMTTACGGDGGGGDGRPSTDEIATALKDADNAAGAAFTAGGVSDEIVDCIAGALHDSDLSDEALNAIVDGDEDYKGDEDDTEVLSSSELRDSITSCVTG